MGQSLCKLDTHGAIGVSLHCLRWCVLVPALPVCVTGGYGQMMAPQSAPYGNEYGQGQYMGAPGPFGSPYYGQHPGFHGGMAPAFDPSGHLSQGSASRATGVVVAPWR